MYRIKIVSILLSFELLLANRLLLLMKNFIFKEGIKSDLFLKVRITLFEIVSILSFSIFKLLSINRLLTRNLISEETMKIFG